METNVQYMTEARHAWNRARRKVFWSRLLAHLEGRSAELLAFDEVEHRLRLKNALYRGVQNIPLDKVVGSVGRYLDFSHAFLPLSADLSQRWLRVAMISLDPVGAGWPPVEAYKVGDAYFVKDGNHRVSVARQMGWGVIEAYVWEYPVPVAGLGSEADIDTMLIEAERQDFLAQTRLDDLRPGHGLHLTAPGGYPALLCQIAAYQDALSRIDDEAKSFEQAVVDWYDLLYETTVQLIEATGVLRHFPDRTAADFFVWIMAHKAELAARYGGRVLITDAARDYQKAHRAGPLGRSWRGLLTWFSRRMAT